MFYLYRTQPLKVNAAIPPVAHIYGSADDRVYVTANLTAPATLVVRSGEKVKTQELEAGSYDVEAPFVAGDPPSFDLLRKGKRIAKGIGPIPH